MRPALPTEGCTPAAASRSVKAMDVYCSASWWCTSPARLARPLRFRRKLAPFVEHARRAGRSAAGRKRGAVIRAWANQRGIAVSARGRIPADVVQQYEAATGGG